MDSKQIIRDLVGWADARPRIRRNAKDDLCWQRARAFLAEEPKQPVSLADLCESVREEVRSHADHGLNLLDEDECESFAREIADSCTPGLNITLARLVMEEPAKLGFPEDIGETCEGVRDVFDVLSRVVSEYLREEAREELSRLRRNREE